MKFTIIQANGWTKLFEPIKAISLVGSADYVDISLPSIAPIQLQLLINNQFPTGCRIVSVSGKTLIQNQSQATVLEPYAIYDLGEGDEILIGQVKIVADTGQDQFQKSSNIKAQVKFSDKVLYPGIDLTGVLKILNAGTKDACQFDVTVDGIPDDCYKLDPIPMLHPGGQEEIAFNLFHRKTKPPAGELDITLTITAPKSYPGEEFKLKHRLLIAPDYSQSLEIVDDLTQPGKSAPEKTTAALAIKQVNNPADKVIKVNSVKMEEPAQEKFQVMKNQSAETEKPAEIPHTKPMAYESLDEIIKDEALILEAVQEVSVDQPAAATTGMNRKAELDLKKIKVVQNKQEDYWDES